jgi:hypothetical protein
MEDQLKFLQELASRQVKAKAASIQSTQETIQKTLQEAKGLAEQSRKLEVPEAQNQKLRAFRITNILTSIGEENLKTLPARSGIEGALGALWRQTTNFHGQNLRNGWTINLESTIQAENEFTAEVIGNEVTDIYS